jgi:hypothetical protein
MRGNRACILLVVEHDARLDRFLVMLEQPDDDFSCPVSVQVELPVQMLDCPNEHIVAIMLDCT